MFKLINTLGGSFAKDVGELVLVTDIMRYTVVTITDIKMHTVVSITDIQVHTMVIV
jgi:hypothetical protein